MYYNDDLGMFPVILITTLMLTLALFEQYGMILLVVLFGGFVSIIVNSGKYPKINKLFDSVF